MDRIAPGACSQEIAPAISYTARYTKRDSRLQAESRSREVIGLELHDAYIAAAARCAPPDNKPLPDELANCRPYLERELALLKEVRVVVALGGLGLRTYLGILRDRGVIKNLAAFPFGHLREYRPAPGLPVVIASRRVSSEPAEYFHEKAHRGNAPTGI